MATSFQAAWATKKEGASKLTAKETFKAWWRACRPPFFIVDLIPIGLGFVLAQKTLGYWPWFTCLVTLFAFFCIHTVSNIANDLFDYLEEVDTEGSIGGTGVIQNGLISPRAISIAIIGLILATIWSGSWLIEQSGQWWMWGVLAFGIFSAVFYVAPPIRYGCRGLGELFVGLNMGFGMVIVTYSSMAKTFTPECLALALPVALMVAGILYYQSLPEIETDFAAGKITLANILGKDRASLVFSLWWPAVWVLMLNLWACNIVAWPVWLCLLTYPLYSKTCKHIAAATEWLDLDQHGHLVRKLYLSNGILLIIALFMR